jgi:LuxR family transcriptional regulator, maltose regulon positive regulatory protein
VESTGLSRSPLPPAASMPSQTREMIAAVGPGRTDAVAGRVARVDAGGVVARNTVKTHVRSLYMKLGTHRRAEAVEFARDLGLLAPSARSPR